MNDLISRAAAIATLETWRPHWDGTEHIVSALAALPAASQPEAEPVAWDTQQVALAIGAMVEEWYDGNWRDHLPLHLIEKRLSRYTTPAPVVPAEGLDAEHLVAAWLAETENFASRHERLMDDILAECDLAPWLHAACQVGIDAALRAQQPAAPVSGVTVKPLVWTLVPDREPDYPRWSADTGLGKTYTVFKAWWGAEEKWGFIGVDGFYHSETEAKAAAQANHEARILAALDGSGVTVQEAARVLLDRLQYSSESDFLDAMQQVMPTEQTACLYAGLTAALSALEGK